MTWLKGERIKGTDATAQAAQVASLTAPGWTSYGTAGTIIAASTTAPTLGTTTWKARYRRSASSDLIHVRLYFLINSTGAWNAGSGDYRFLLPFAASADAINDTAGSFFVDDFGTALRVGTWKFFDSTHIVLHRPDSTSPIGSAGPGTAWNTNDTIKISGSYDPA